MSFKRLFDAYSKLLTGALIAYSVIRVRSEVGALHELCAPPPTSKYLTNRSWACQIPRSPISGLFSNVLRIHCIYLPLRIGLSRTVSGITDTQILDEFT